MFSSHRRSSTDEVSLSIRSHIACVLILSKTNKSPPSGPLLRGPTFSGFGLSTSLAPPFSLFWLPPFWARLRGTVLTRTSPTWTGPIRTGKLLASLGLGLTRITPITWITPITSGRPLTNIECKVMSLDARVRMEGVTCVERWVTVELERLPVEQESDPSRQLNPKPPKRHRKLTITFHHSLKSRAHFFVVDHNGDKDDDQARSPHMRPSPQTHRVNLDLLFASVNLDSNVSVTCVYTDQWIADILTKGSFALEKWIDVLVPQIMVERAQQRTMDQVTRLSMSPYHSSWKKLCRMSGSLTRSASRSVFSQIVDVPVPQIWKKSSMW